MNPFTVSIETKSHGVITERVLMVDKLAFEKAAKANGWSLSNSELTFTAFIAWRVMKRLNQIPDELTYEEFINDELVDALITQEENPTTA